MRPPLDEQGLEPARIREYSTYRASAEAAAFVDKTLTFVLQQIRAAMGTTPVYFALGNCDSYTGVGPDSTFLANNAQQLYTLALNGAGNQQDVMIRP